MVILAHCNEMPQPFNSKLYRPLTSRHWPSMIVTAKAWLTSTKSAIMKQWPEHCNWGYGWMGAHSELSLSLFFISKMYLGHSKQKVKCNYAAKASWILFTCATVHHCHWNTCFYSESHGHTEWHVPSIQIKQIPTYIHSHVHYGKAENSP